jgi:hypothetical protein
VSASLEHTHSIIYLQKAINLNHLPPDIHITIEITISCARNMYIYRMIPYEGVLRAEPITKVKSVWVV